MSKKLTKAQREVVLLMREGRSIRQHKIYGYCTINLDNGWKRIGRPTLRKLDDLMLIRETSIFSYEYTLTDKGKTIEI